MCGGPSGKTRRGMGIRKSERLVDQVETIERGEVLTSITKPFRPHLRTTVSPQDLTSFNRQIVILALTAAASGSASRGAWNHTSVVISDQCISVACCKMSKKNRKITDKNEKLAYL